MGFLMLKIKIYGVIGWDILADDVFDQVEGHEGPIDVHINSYGGFVTDAVAIYNILERHEGRVTAFVDGVSASAASIVMLGADEIAAPSNATIMIHRPWGASIGTSDDMRRSANVLDMTEEQMLDMYASRMSVSRAEVADMLDEETWMTAQQALDVGLVDVVLDAEEDEEVQSLIAAAAQRYQKVRSEHEDGTKLGSIGRLEPDSSNESPRDEKITQRADQRTNKEVEMSDKKGKSPVRARAEANQPSTEPEDAGNVVDIADVRAEERSRVQRAYALVERHGFGSEVAQAWVDEDASIEVMNAEALELLVESQNEVPRGSGEVVVGQGESEKRADGVRLALEARCNILTGPEATEARQGNPYASMTLSEMCMQFSEDRQGSRSQVVSGVLASARPMAVGNNISHTSSDFVGILANIQWNQLLRGWESAPETWNIWTNPGVLNDYKIAKRSSLNLFSGLDKVEEGAHYESGTLADRAVDIQLAKYGKVFGVTREAILNDSLQAMTQVPLRMGQAASRTVGNIVYNVLFANTFGSGSLFAVSHNNTHAVALDSAGLQTLMAAMMTQQDEDAAPDSTLNIQPRFLLAPAALMLEARQLLNGAIISDGGAGVTNVQQGVMEPVFDGRLDLNDADTFYAIADPAVADTVEVAFLDGIRQPQIERTESSTVDGVFFKARVEVGVAPLDRKSMQRGTGA